MRLVPISAAALLIAISSAAASNRNDRNVCGPSQSGTSLTIEQAIARAEALGYAVKEAKRSKGCWEIEGYDRNGAEIEIRLDPASGEPVKPNNWRMPAGR